jgi:hypothetical protein
MHEVLNAYCIYPRCCSALFGVQLQKTPHPPSLPKQAPTVLKSPRDETKQYTFSSSLWLRTFGPSGLANG